MIRLDVIPITSLPQTTKIEHTEVPHLPKINCLLHSRPMLTHQHLEVSVNGVRLDGVQEADQLVYTWQMFKASDVVRIALFKSGVEIKSWRGCWNERDAILHRGQLQVLVFFDNKSQPANLIETAALSPTILPLPETEQVHEESVAPQEAAAHESQNGTNPIFSDTPAEAQTSLSSPVQTQFQTMLTPSVDQGDTQGRDVLICPVEQGVIAFYAAHSSPTQTLTELRELVAQMPSKTLIVDLRQQGSTRGKRQANNDPSKATLRAEFGAKYWDRSWAILFDRQYIPPEKGNALGKFHSVITNPDLPDGMPALVKHYQEGYSLVLMDSQTVYDESPRRAVIEELRKQIPDVKVGSIK